MSGFKSTKEIWEYLISGGIIQSKIPLSSRVKLSKQARLFVKSMRNR